MVVLLKFRLGRISLCYNKGVWSFYFCEYTYNFCDRSVKEGRYNVIGFFSSVFSFPRMEKKTPSENLNTVSNLRNNQKAAIFVRKPQLSCKIGLMRGREENLFVLPENWKSYPFCHTFSKSRGTFQGTLYRICISLVFVFAKFNPILISKPISFSRNMIFF